MITWSMARRNQPGLICSCCMTQISHGAMKQRQVAPGSRGSNGSSTDAGEICWFDWGLSNLRGSHGAYRRACPQLFWPCHTTSRFWCEAQTCTCWMLWVWWVCPILCFRGRWSVFVRIFEAMMSRKMQARAALAVAPSSVGLAEPWLWGGWLEVWWLLCDICDRVMCLKCANLCSGISSASGRCLCLRFDIFDRDWTRLNHRAMTSHDVCFALRWACETAKQSKISLRQTLQLSLDSAVSVPTKIGRYRISTYLNNIWDYWGILGIMGDLPFLQWPVSLRLTDTLLRDETGRDLGEDLRPTRWSELWLGSWQS